MKAVLSILWLLLVIAIIGELIWMIWDNSVLPMKVLATTVIVTIVVTVTFWSLKKQ
jgi:hypothetical protein